MSLLTGLLEDEPLSVLQEPEHKIFVAVRKDESKGDGSIKNPYAGQTAALLDAVLAAAGANTHIVLGPGEFTTAGGHGNGHIGAWRPRPGQRITGAGMFKGGQAGSVFNI